MKSLRIMGIKLFLVMCGFVFPFSAAAIHFSPENFITIGIYGLLKTQRDYARNDHTYNRVLIIGDSLAQVSYMPSILSEDTYNYGIGNETLIDGYYRLLEYLDNHEKPEYIFCSYNPTEFKSQSAVWSVALYQHGLSLDIAQQIMRDAENYNADSGLIRDNAQLQVLAYYYGFHPDSIKICLKGLYKNLFMDESCYERYIEQKNWVEEHRGQWKHYMEGQTGEDINRSIAAPNVTKFQVAEIADVYLRKIFELCLENDIRVIYETIPFNRATYEKTDPEYVASYKAYLDNVQADFPEVVINSEISCYENRYFSDCFHFNLEGTDKFSKYIRNKYDHIFGEDQQ